MPTTDRHGTGDEPGPGSGPTPTAEPDDAVGTGPIRSLSAVTLACADMARSVAFYEALGFRRRYGGPDEAFTSYAVGTGYLNLQLDPAHAPVPAIWGRAIFWVDDVDAVHARALAAGMAPATEPADAPWGERYFHLLDPDGHELSFARPLDDPARGVGAAHEPI